MPTQREGLRKFPPASSPDKLPAAPLMVLEQVAPAPSLPGTPRGSPNAGARQGHVAYTQPALSGLQTRSCLATKNRRRVGSMRPALILARLRLKVLPGLGLKTVFL